MVEVYLQPELEEIVTDADKKTEWEEKVMSLGLEGQLQLTNNSDKNAASPYTFMNEHMKNVFTVLCPTQVALEKYNKTQIPLEVLSHVALCKQEGYFAKLEVWYDNMHPDPIIVGYVSGSSSIRPTMHLVARWGDEIIPFEMLVAKAKQRITESYKQYLSGVAQKAKSMLELADCTIAEFLSGTKNSYSMQVDATFSINNRDWTADLPF